MRPIFLFVTLMLIVSCSDFRKQEWLGEINALQQTTDSLGKVLGQHAFEALETQKDQMQKTDARIKAGYKSDTLPLETARRLKRWKEAYLLLEPLSQSYPMLRNALKKEQEQLAALREDMQHGDGARNKYEAYLERESNNVRDLRLLITEYQESYREVQQTYDELNPEIELFAQNLVAPEE